ncbi:MAG: chalcone isomerase family protein [Desulfobacterales bacterium]|nr:chalcone isomerase family protein [Desulfobacterales bacterium]
MSNVKSSNNAAYFFILYTKNFYLKKRPFMLDISITRSTQSSLFVNFIHTPLTGVSESTIRGVVSMTLSVRKIAIVLILSTAQLGFSGAASAAQSRGIHFADTIQVEGYKLGLRGVGILQKFIFKGYLVGLYLPEGVAVKDALTDVPKRLEYYFYRDMAAEDFRSTGAPLMAQNVGQAETDRLEPKLAAFNQLYRDVKEKQRYTITYIPGKGTELGLEGESLGWVPGFEFAAAYFAIWLGPNPVSEELKEGLLDPETAAPDTKTN